MLTEYGAVFAAKPHGFEPVKSYRIVLPKCIICLYKLINNFSLKTNLKKCFLDGREKQKF
jgi:hypothetical protein